MTSPISQPSTAPSLPSNLSLLRRTTTPPPSSLSFNSPISFSPLFALSLSFNPKRTGAFRAPAVAEQEKVVTPEEEYRKDLGKPCELYVCNLPQSCDISELLELFKPYGTVHSVEVGHLGEAYQEWVHQPIVSKEGPRFLQNNILEFFTRTVWWAVPTIWLPVVFFFVSMSIHMGQALPEVAVMVATGILVWTLLEYSLHRFLFHMETKTYCTLSSSWMSSQASYGWSTPCFPPTATAILCVPHVILQQVAGRTK